MILAFDSETHKLVPGLLAPPPVVFSSCSRDVRNGEPWLLSAGHGEDHFRKLLEDPDVILVGQNVAFDMAVIGAAYPSLLRLIFHAYIDGRVRDTKLRAELLDIRSGRRQMNGGTFILENGEWKKANYGLADLETRYLGIDRSEWKKGDDVWRLRYGELDGVPLEEWPSDARQYALDDAANTLRVFEHQSVLGKAADYMDEDRPEAIVNEYEQVYAAFCLHLISCWGVRTDPASVAALDAHVTAEYRKIQEKMLEEGLYRLERCTPAQVREGKVDLYLTARKRKKATKAQLKANDPAVVHEPDGAWIYTEEPNVPHRYVKNQDVIRARVEGAYAKLGKKPPLSDPTDKFPRGQTKTDADTLEQSEDPLLEELADGGPIGTIKKTFLPTLKRGLEVPINTRYQPLLNTGRISSSEPNLNNIPRQGGVRECFRPREGYYYCSVDYDCAELRSWAQVCLWLFGKSAMAEFFQKNPKGDPHLEMAASILGITTEEAVRRKRAGDEEIKGVRQMSKALLFGLPGGLGVETLIGSARKGYGVIMDRQEATLRREQWKARWPESQWYFDLMGERTEFGDTSVMQLRPGGKKHRIRGGVGFTDGCNGFFQALTADAAKWALCKIVYECYVDETSPLFGSRVVGFLYDEVLTEIPIGDGWSAHRAAHRQAEIMCSAAQEWLVDVPVTAAPALMNRWWKGAEPVYNAEGMLIPWEPKA